MSEFAEDYDEMKVTEEGQSANGWTFLVELGHGDGLTEYLVNVNREYWTLLTGRRVEPEELVKMTFEFLLSKRSKDLIKRKFDVSEVSAGFSDYEMEVKKKL